MTCFSDEAHSIVKNCKELIQALTNADPSKYPSELLALEGKTKIFQVHFAPESTKQNQLLILDNAWDNTPVPMLEIPTPTETKADSSENIRAAEPMSTQAEIAIEQSDKDIATEKNKVETTPPEKPTSLPQPSNPKYEPRKKNLRKPLFQEDKDGSSTNSPKKSKKEE
jgi:hypothetical protein